MERDSRSSMRYLLYLLLALVAINVVLSPLLTREPQRDEIPYSQFLQKLEEGEVATVAVGEETIEGTLKTPLPGGKSEFVTVRVDPELTPALEANEVVYTGKQESGAWSSILTWLVLTVLLVAFWSWAFRRMGRAVAGGPLTFGKSRAKVYVEQDTKVSFADVAGVDEAKTELQEVVRFLKEPESYSRLGAHVPKGVLLVGPPGTGKTLLARAVAGEAGVPFFSINGSEFVELFVGVGAARVRDLFEQAKKDAPSIIFIDELDAIGRVRGAGNMGGGSDEREQTLNQILTEMDGFDGSEGVIVLAATNRPEILDPALLRAGRFDRRVTVNPPDQQGRQKILGVHTRSVPLADDVDLAALASSTPGMVGADLRNLVNEAALGAARRGAEAVARRDFTDALEKIVLGTARRILLSPEDRRLTAYHESGHALLGMLEPGADPVRKVSIIPRGSALGVTFQSPDADRYGYTASYLRGRITGALGGRAAEEIVFGDVTTGAESDLEHATALARQMVGRWGMSDKLGLVSVLPGPGQEGLFFPSTAGASSEHTRELVDEEVRRITDESYTHALEILRDHREQLDNLAGALLENETLDEADAYRAAGLPARPAIGDQRDPVAAGHDVSST